LAYLAAKSYGLLEDADSILEQAQFKGVPPVLPESFLLIPPKPIMGCSDANWPINSSTVLVPTQSIVEQAPQVNVTHAPEVYQKVSPDVEATPPWGADEIEFDDDIDAGGWDIDAELDIEIPDELPIIPGVVVNTFAPPSKGPIMGSIWVRNSTLAADHVAAGSFETAMQVIFV
jgi:coatomer protein complex subunit alpha (xenin)